MNNVARFIQLRRPISDILAHDGTAAGAVTAADQFRDEILNLDANAVNERYRARLVRQGNLWDEGVRLGAMMRKEKNSANCHQHDAYYGGKWGVYLRAPNLWFRLLDDHGPSFVALADIADIRRGITSGKDCFFFPRDCSERCLQAQQNKKEFKTDYGVPRTDVQSGRVKLVSCGEGYGEIRPVEAKYLQPEVHSLMEVDSFSVRPEDCSRQILLVGRKRGKLKDKYVRAYIKWGEDKGYHRGSTCASRRTEKREWYYLTEDKTGHLLWPMAQQYKHVIPTNDNGLICNHNLFYVSPKEGTVATLAGILNSSWVVLSKFQYGRPVGVEGNLKTEVVDVKMLLVPDPAKGSQRARERVAAAFEKLKKRKTSFFLSERRLREMAYRLAGKEDKLDELSGLCELDMADRRELDDAVLQLLGVRSKRDRNELIEALYAYLREFFEWTRRKEEKAILNKKRAKRLGPARPSEIASQIHEQIKDEQPSLLRHYDPDFIDKTKPFDTFDFPADGAPRLDQGLFNSHGVAFMKGKKTIGVVDTRVAAQDPLVILLANSGVRGLVRVPHEDKECRSLRQRYEKFVRAREKCIRELIEDRTADEDMQEKIHEALMPLLLQTD